MFGKRVLQAFTSRKLESSAELLSPKSLARGNFLRRWLLVQKDLDAVSAGHGWPSFSGLQHPCLVPDLTALS